MCEDNTGMEEVPLACVSCTDDAGSVAEEGLEVVPMDDGLGVLAHTWVPSVITLLLIIIGGEGTLLGLDPVVTVDKNGSVLVTRLTSLQMREGTGLCSWVCISVGVGP